MKENRTKRVTFRLTEGEYKKLERLANSAEKAVSAYCRDCVLGKKITIIHGADELITQLRYIGNNLNQLTWRVNEGTLSTVHLGDTKFVLTRIYDLLNEKLKGV